jgi:hypothetical protein
MTRDLAGFDSEFFSDDANEPLPQWVRNVKLPWNFGPRWWLFLHSLCLLLSDEPTDDERAKRQQKIYDFVEDIPCKSCRGHAQVHVQQYPPDLRTRRTLFTWSWRFHNIVNQRLGKAVVAFDAALRLCANPVILQPGVYAPNVPRGTAGSEADARLMDEEHVHQDHAQRTFAMHEEEEDADSARASAQSSGATTMMPRAYAASRPKLGAMRTFWDSSWGALEWVLVTFACFGITSLLFCLVRAMRASKSNHLAAGNARHPERIIPSDEDSTEAASTQSSHSIRSQSRVERGNHHQLRVRAH